MSDVEELESCLTCRHGFLKPESLKLEAELKVSEKRADYKLASVECDFISYFFSEFNRMSWFNKNPPWKAAKADRNHPYIKCPAYEGPPF